MKPSQFQGRRSPRSVSNLRPTFWTFLKQQGGHSSPLQLLGEACFWAQPSRLSARLPNAVFHSKMGFSAGELNTPCLRASTGDLRASAAPPCRPRPGEGTTIFARPGKRVDRGHALAWPKLWCSHTCECCGLTCSCCWSCTCWAITFSFSGYKWASKERTCRPAREKPGHRLNPPKWEGDGVCVCKGPVAAPRLPGPLPSGFCGLMEGEGCPKAPPEPATHTHTHGPSLGPAGGHTCSSSIIRTERSLSSCCRSSIISRRRSSAFSSSQMSGDPIPSSLSSALRRFGEEPLNSCNEPQVGGGRRREMGVKWPWTAPRQGKSPPAKATPAPTCMNLLS